MSLKKIFDWWRRDWEQAKSRIANALEYSPRWDRLALRWLVETYACSFRLDDRVVFRAAFRRMFEKKLKLDTTQVFGHNPYSVVRVVAKPKETLWGKPMLRHRGLLLANSRRLIRFVPNDPFHMEPREFSSLLFKHASWKIGVIRFLQAALARIFVSGPFLFLRFYLRGEILHQLLGGNIFQLAVIAALDG